MADRYYVYYVFEDDPDEEAVGEVVRFLQDSSDILWPQDGDHEAYVDAAITDGEFLLPKHAGTEFRFSVGDREHLGLPTATISIDEQFVLPRDGESDTAAIDRLNALYGLFEELYEAFCDAGFEPAYVFGTNFAERGAVTDSATEPYVTSERIQNDGVPGVFWFQIFPPGMVETLGEERVGSTPAFRREVLADGAVLLATSQGVIVSEPENYLEEAADHLGLEYVQ